MAAYGYSKGNPYNAFRGVDGGGNQCGIGATAAYPYLYLANPIYDITVRYCVNACPYYTSGSTATSVTPVGYYVYSSSTTSTFTYNIVYDTNGNQVYSSSGTNPAVQASGNIVGYDTSLTLSRLCVPNANMFSSVLISASSTASAFSQGDLSNFITDIANNWKWLLAALGWGVLISFFFMFMLRCLAGCIVWCSLFGLIIFFIGLGLIFLYNAGMLGAATNVATYLGVPSINSGSN